MLVALPIWDQRLSPVFDVASRLVLFEVDRQAATRVGELDLGSLDPLGRLRQLREAGVEVLLCGAISEDLQRQCEATGMEVLPFLTGRWESLLAAYRTGRLEGTRFRMPGCRPGTAGRGRCRRRRGGRQTKG